MSKKMVAVVAVLVFLLGGASIFAFLSWSNKEELVAAPVSFPVNAEGWSAETSSPIPLHITGETANKEKVDEKYFIGHSEGDLSLKPGTYTVEVYASPVNADGSMYKVPEPAKLVVPKATDKSQTLPSASADKPEAQPSASADKPEVQPSPSASTDSGAPTASAAINLSPAPANEITDEDIEKAQAAMKDAGLDEEEVNTFIDSARKARQAELDRIAAEEARRALFKNMAATYSAVLDNPANYIDFGYSSASEVTFYGYRLIDINGDGRPELILSHACNDEYVYDLDVFTTSEDGTQLVHVQKDEGGNFTYGVGSAGGYRGSTCYSPSSAALYEEAHDSWRGEGSVYKYVMAGNKFNSTHVQDFVMYEDSFTGLSLPGDCQDFNEKDDKSLSDRSALEELAARS